MELIVFEKEAYYKILAQVMAMCRDAIRDGKQEAIRQSKGEDDWIDVEEAKRLLNVKSKTKMQQLRSNMEIKYSKFGKKIKYSKKSILEFLNKNIKTL